MVTKQFLRVELRELRSEFRSEFGALRLEMVERFHRQTVWLAGTVVAAAGAITAAVPIVS